MSKYILQPVSIPPFINIKPLKKYVKKDIRANQEYFDEMDLTYKISSPKKAEWILSKAICGSKLVGRGNKCTDIKVNDKTHIDVSVLTLNKSGSHTNEKSLMQNFSTGSNLDVLFNNHQGPEAIEIFKNKFREKYSTCHNNDIYYFIFVCHQKNVYATCLKLFLSEINKMEFSSFSKSNKNILINNFIDDSHGNVKLYQSKKRLELRLRAEIIESKHSVQIF